jgi:ABC-type uncharacterized transport system permease subunit
MRRGLPVTEFFDILANPSFWVAVLRIATPLILGTLGVLLCERAGVLNLGIEGIMVAGAFTGWLAVYSGAPLWGGVAVAALTGALLGGLHALLTVTLALSQHVSGLGITLLATALSYYGYRVSFPKVNTPPTVQPFQEMGWLGIPVLAQQTPLTLLALGLVPLIGYVLYRTPVGLAVRMVGENPQAAEGQGVSVAAVRSGAIVAGSALLLRFEWIGYGFGIVLLYTAWQMFRSDEGGFDPITAILLGLIQRRIGTCNKALQAVLMAHLREADGNGDAGQHADRRVEGGDLLQADTQAFTDTTCSLIGDLWQKNDELLATDTSGSVN